MISSENKLVARGMILNGTELEHTSCSFSDLLMLLKSTEAYKRSIGARLLGASGNIEAVEHLCNALVQENKLYTKIEICNALSSLGISSVCGLVPLLGRVDSNQHRDVDCKRFRKKSYPLPRDIVARILIRIGPPALPILMQVLESDNLKQISESIDAIGHISFYHNNQSCYQSIIDCYIKYKSNHLIVWKLVRAMSAFPYSVEFLNKLLEIETHSGIRQEITRSLEMINCS